MGKGPGGEDVNKVNVKVVPDTSGFAQKLKAQLEKIEQQLSPIEVGVDVDTAAARAQLAALGKNIKGGTNGVLGSLRKNLDSTDSSMKNFAGTVNHSSKKILGLTRVGWIMVAVFSAAAPAVSTVAALLAGLPSLFLTVGAAAGAVALGMDGIKKAAQQLEGPFKKLKASVSGTFEKGMTPVFAKLKEVFPVLQEGMTKVSEGVINMADAFVNVLTSARGLKDLEAILGGIGKFLTQIEQFVEQGTAAFLRLGAVGSQSLDLLAGVLNRWMTDFNQIVDRLSNSGAFREAFKGLAQITESLLRLFNKLFEAGVKAMAKLGYPISNMITQLGNALIALMPALTQISATLSNVLAAAFKALTPIIEALTPAFNALVSLIGDALVQAINAVAGPLKAVANVLGNIVLTAVQTLQPFIKPLANAFGELARVVGQALVVALNALKPIIKPLAKFIGQILVIAVRFFVQVLKALMPLVRLVANFLNQLLIALKPLFPELIKLARSISKQLIKALRDLMPVIIRGAKAVMPLLIKAFKFAVKAAIELVPVIIDIIRVGIRMAKKLAKFIIPAMRRIWRIVKKVWPHIKGIIKGAMKVIRGVVKTVMGILEGDWRKAWNGIKMILSGALQIIWNTVKAIFSTIVGIAEREWNDFKEAIGDGIDKAVDYIKAFPGRVLDQFLGLNDLLVSSGESLVNGFLDGIKGAWDKVTGFLGGAMEKVRNFFPFSPAKTGPFSGRGYTTYSGKALVRDFADSIEKTAPQAIKAVEKMMAATQLGGGNWQGVLNSEGFGNSPLVGNLTMQSNGDTPTDLDEVEFALRRISRGGVYA